MKDIKNFSKKRECTFTANNHKNKRIVKSIVLKLEKLTIFIHYIVFREI